MAMFQICFCFIILYKQYWNRKQKKNKFTYIEHQIDLKYSIESWFLTFELSLFSYIPTLVFPDI